MLFAVFNDVDVTHVEESINPVRDAQLILTELILKDLSSLEKRVLKDQKLAKNSKDATIQKRLPTEEKILELLNQGTPASKGDFSQEELEYIEDLQLLTLKPMFFCANVLEQDILKENEYVKDLRQYADSIDCKTLQISGQIESEIAQIEPEQKSEFLESLGLKKSGIEQVIKEGYSLLGLHYLFYSWRKRSPSMDFSKRYDSSSNSRSYSHRF